MQFSCREEWGWTMEMDDDSVEIERSQHASTTQRGKDNVRTEQVGARRVTSKSGSP